MPRERSNATLESPVLTRPRAHASLRPDFLYVSDEQAALLNECRIEGLTRGIQTLARLTVDWEQIGWQAVGTGTGIVAGKLSYGFPSEPEVKTKLPSEGLQGIGVDKVTGKIKDFLTSIADKAMARLEKHPWVQRVVRLMGLGIDFLVAYLKKLLTSVEVIKTLIPFYAQIQGVIQSVTSLENAVNMSRSLNSISRHGGHIGSGVPAVALGGFLSYLIDERAIQQTKAAYTFTKTLISTLAQVLTAGASSALDLVTKVVELVVSWIYKIYMAWTFDAACKKCQTWVANGSGVEEMEEEFSNACAGCPLLGAFFFAIADHIGTINLTSMFSKGSRVLPSNSVWAAGAKVFEIQVQASQYLQSIVFKPKFREEVDRDRYGYLLRGIDTIATSAQAAPDRKPGKLKKVWNFVKKVFD